MAHEIITPTRLNQGDEVDLMYGIMDSLRIGCGLLDADASITDVNYEALCYSAAYDNLQVTKQAGGNILGDRGTVDQYGYYITPRGISQAARLEWLYDTLYALNTLTAKIDADANPPSTVTYNTDYFVGRITKSVENQRGVLAGPTTRTFLFSPKGVYNLYTLVDMYWDIVYCLQGIWALCTSDAAPATATYTALAYTAVVKPTIQNSQGTTLGN